MPEVLARLEHTKKVYRTGDTIITALDTTTLEVRSEELVLIEGSWTWPLHLEQGDVLPYLRYLVISFHSYAETQKLRLHFLSDKE